MQIIMIAVIALLPITGFVMAITPYLMKKTEWFAVTVPEIAASDSYLISMKKHYLFVLLVLTVVLTGGNFIFLASGNILASVFWLVAGLFIVVAAGYALMLYYRKKVNAYKIEKGWKAQVQESVAFVADSDIPHAISLKWNFLYIPIIVVTILVGILGYPLMPDILPVQIDINGEVSNAIQKGPLAILFAAGIQGFIAACFLFAHWSITHSKKPSEPSAPATSALAYGMFAHAQSLFLLASGLLICSALISIPLAFMGVFSLLQSGIIAVVVTMIITIGAIVISIIYGQGGSRVFKRLEQNGTMFADDDQYWKLGIFYWNAQDASWFIPARFGIGWTVNFGQPAVWVLTILLTALTIGFVAAILMIY